MLPYDSRVLILETATISMDSPTIFGGKNLFVLNMTHSHFSRVSLLSSIFRDLVSLTIMDLRHTNMLYLPNYAFKGLYNLKTLILIGSVISHIQDHVFPNSEHLRHLSADNLFLSKISGSSFCEMSGIRRLNLSHNTLTKLTLDTFYCIHNLEILDISHNQLLVISRTDAATITNLHTILADVSSVCCYFRTVQHCTHKSHIVESTGPGEKCRSTLSDSLFVHFTFLFIGISIIAINVLSITCKHRMRKQSKDIVFSTNLSIADSLLGLYYGMIAVFEWYYGDNIIQRNDPMRIRWICRFLGILPPLSIMMSSTLVCLISLQRLMVTKYHFAKKLINIDSLRNQSALLILIWIFYILIIYTYVMHCHATSLLCFMPYTIHNNGILLTVITMSLFVVCEYICLIISIIAYINIVKYITTVEAVRKKTVQVKYSSSTVSKTASHIILISLCNCVGISILVIGSYAISGIEINTTLSNFALVLLLPLNSIANPFFYAFLPKLKAHNS